MPNKTYEKDNIGNKPNILYEHSIRKAEASRITIQKPHSVTIRLFNPKIYNLVFEDVRMKSTVEVHMRLL